MIKDINKAVEVLKSGGVILYPTDTVWGIGCDATNKDAVAKIYKIKKRNTEKSMLILLNNLNSVYSYVQVIPEVAFDIIELSENPITIIFPGAKNLAENLIATDGSIGIRITKEAFTNKLLQKFRKPIVSTSANIAETKTPLKFDQIVDKIKESVDYIVEYKQNEAFPGKSSSIIKIGLKNEVEIIRK